MQCYPQCKGIHLLAMYNKQTNTTASMVYVIVLFKVQHNNYEHACANSMTLHAV